MGRGSVYRILHDETVKLSWEVRRKFALDAARGMNYLHSSDPILIHRDLKSHNLLVRTLQSALSQLMVNGRESDPTNVLTD
jgi:serine/threonine protein kinase